MNKLILAALLATFVILGISTSEAKTEVESRIFRLPWIPLPPINRPPATTNPGTTNPAPPANSCTKVEGCTDCNKTKKQNRCDDSADGGKKEACYMEYCAIDSAAVYCKRECTP